MQTASPFPFQPHLEVYLDNPKSLEKICHAKLARNCFSGEWFEVDLETVVEVIVEALKVAELDILECFHYSSEARQLELILPEKKIDLGVFEENLGQLHQGYKKIAPDSSFSDSENIYEDFWARMERELRTAKKNCLER